VSERPYQRYIRPDEDAPDISLYVQEVSDDAKAWFDAQKAVTKLEVSEQVGKLASTAMMGIVMGLIGTTVLMLWFVALALWLGQVLANNALGFLLAGGIFLVLGILFFLLWRTMLRDKVTLAVINAMHDDE
jgi:hypothetical protein